MADNVEWTSGSGTTLATDEIGGVHYPRSKISIGANGSATDLAFGQGLSNASIPVVIASDQSAIDVNATVEVTVTDVTVTSSALPTGAATEATLAGVALESGGNLATIAGKDFATQTTLSSLNGKVTACNTGAVVVSSSALPSGASTAAKQPALGTAGSAASDVISIQGIASMTPVAVSDNSSSLTVDAPVGTPVFVRLSDGSSAITTLPVSLASVPSHAVTVASGGVASGAIASGAVASGAFASGSIASGAIVAGAVAAGAASFVKLEDAASANGDAGVPAFAVRKATPANTSGTDGDYEALQMSAGRLWTSATIDAALPAGTNAIGKLAANSGVDVGDVDVLTCGTITPGTGATNLGKAEDAAHSSGDVGVMALGVRAATPTDRSAGPTDGDYEPFATNSVGAVWTSQAADPAGGATVYHLVSAASTNATTVKASAGKLIGWYITNTNAAMRKLAFHNASSTPTAGASVYFSLAIPGGSAAAAANAFSDIGIAFSTGISITTVTEGADSGTTGVGSGDLIINLFYK